MKKFFLLSVYMFGCLFAHVSLLYAQAAPQAQALLKQLSGTYAQMEAFSVDFSYEITYLGTGPSYHAAGKAFVQGPRYRLDLKEQQISCDSLSTWTYFKASHEVTITPSDPKSSLNLQNLFQLLQKDYRYRLRHSAGHTRTLDLIPQDKAPAWFQIQLQIDAKAQTLQRCTFFYKDDSRHIYRLKAPKPEKAQPASYFRLDQAYKDAEIIDLR